MLLLLLLLLLWRRPVGCFGVATCGKAPGRHLHADAAAAQMLWAQEGAVAR